jgi:membrane associated rhomboid family serine protease
MKRYLKNNLWILGALVGSIAGYLYWKFVGCNSGSCLITSSSVNSTIYFGVMGALLVSLFQSKKKISSDNQ